MCFSVCSQRPRGTSVGGERQVRGQVRKWQAHEEPPAGTTSESLRDTLYFWFTEPNTVLMLFPVSTYLLSKLCPYYTELNLKESNLFI